MLPVCQQLPQLPPKTGHEACQHSQGISKRQMNSAGSLDLGSRLAPPCQPHWLHRCHTLSKGLSHGVKGSWHFAGSWHSQSLTKLDSQQRDCTKDTHPRRQMRRSWFEQSNPLPGCVLIPLAQMEKQEKQERSSDDGLKPC